MSIVTAEGCQPVAAAVSELEELLSKLTQEMDSVIKERVTKWQVRTARRLNNAFSSCHSQVLNSNEELKVERALLPLFFSNPKAVAEILEAGSFGAQGLS